MMKDRLMADLKSAMLSGDKQRVSVLQMLRSALLNVEIAENARDTGLTDEQIINVLTKEAKKRDEASKLYEKAGSMEKAKAEKEESRIISEYLPSQIDDDELLKIVTAAIKEVQPDGMKDMGKVIGMVKSQIGSQAAGSRIAAMVKGQLG